MKNKVIIFIIFFISCQKREVEANQEFVINSNYDLDNDDLENNNILDEYNKNEDDLNEIEFKKENDLMKDINELFQKNEFKTLKKQKRSMTQQEAKDIYEKNLTIEEFIKRTFEEIGDTSSIYKEDHNLSSNNNNAKILNTVSEFDLIPIISNIKNEKIKLKINQNQDNFIEYLTDIMNDDSLNLVLVDKEYSIKEYKPKNLVPLDDYNIKVNKKDMYLDQKVLEILIRMLQFANVNYNLYYVIGSAYRSYDYQDNLFNNYVKNMGQEKTEALSAKPGHSQHQLGTAFDFSPIEESFGESKEGKWMLKNSCNFGFSLSYPQGYEKITGYDYEPWHYRYIGKSACNMQKEFFNTQQELLEFLNDQKERLEELFKK